MASYLAKWATQPPPSVRKAVGARPSNLTFKSLLTYPCVDLAGDYVRGDGCSFESHEADPSIDLEHGRHPHVKGMPVCWARESLSKPGAPYAVEMVRLNFADDGKPANYHTVPVGTEYYDKSCPVSMQVFAMREDGTLPAASLEFKAVPGYLKSLGRSPLEPRDAYDFQRCDVVRWTVCAQGVNPGALTLTKSRGQVPPADPIMRVLTDGRVNVGGRWEPLHGAIRKALAPYRPATNRTTVRVERKAMEDDDAMAGMMGAEMVPEVESDMDADADMDAGTTPTAQAAYDLAQGARDLCDQIKDAAGKGEHKPGRKKLMALCDKLDAISEMAMSVGQMVDADLSDGAGDEVTEEPDVSPEDMEPDEDADGVLKGIPPIYKKAVKRFKLADLAGATVAKADDLTPAETDRLMGELKALKKKLSLYS